MKIYTKTGDKGKTSLLGGSRVLKSSLRIDTYGTVDELNSYIGLLADFEINQQRQELLRNVQNNLFSIGSHLAAEDPAKFDRLPSLEESEIEQLEKEIDKMTSSLPEMRNFILPGGHPEVSYCHIARSVCRRTERLVVALGNEEDVNEIILIYLNRLSDFLFTLARKMAAEHGVEEIPWKPGK